MMPPELQANVVEFLREVELETRLVEDDLPDPETALHFMYREVLAQYFTLKKVPVTKAVRSEVRRTTMRMTAAAFIVANLSEGYGKKMDVPNIRPELAAYGLGVQKDAKSSKARPTRWAPGYTLSRLLLRLNEIDAALKAGDALTAETICREIGSWQLAVYELASVENPAGIIR